MNAGLEPAAFRRLCVETFVSHDFYSSSTQPPSGGCVLKRDRFTRGMSHLKPAAFRRLCVETVHRCNQHSGRDPAAFRRLCVETQKAWNKRQCLSQPPSGGCVLKLLPDCGYPVSSFQPPSGGCVLKLQRQWRNGGRRYPAAFRRLCVETCGRLTAMSVIAPAAFRRLCVETASSTGLVSSSEASRLQAAVC